MELDKRIKEGKKPLTCFDVKEAKQFIGKECYFSNYLRNFNNINSIAPRALLHKITEDKDASNPYYSCPDYFAYCLPCEWVKEPEKKYRPFSLNEFLERYKIGDTVTFRLKKDEHIPEAECLVEYKRMITGYEILPEDKDTPGKGSILLGGCPPTGLARLFELYEIKNGYYCPAVWHPFGVIDEDKE